MNGVEAASRDLFGKNVDKLSLAEGARARRAAEGAQRLHAARSSRPRAAAPQPRALADGGGGATSRPAKAQSAAAQRAPLRSPRTSGGPTRANEPLALDAVRAFIDSILPDALQEGDVNVYTTLDINAQKAADRAVLRQAAQISEPRDAVRRRPGDRAGAGRARRARSAHRRHPRARSGGRTQQAADSTAPSRRAGSPARRSSRSSTPRRSRRGMTPATESTTSRSRSPGPRCLAARELRGEYIGTHHVRPALMLSANAATVRVSQRVGVPSVIRRRAATASRVRCRAHAVDRARRGGRDAAGARGGVRAVRERRDARASAAGARIEAPDGTRALERRDRAGRHGRWIRRTRIRSLRCSRAS